MKIGLIHPSYGRPSQAKQALHAWLAAYFETKATSVQHYLCVDAGDETIIDYYNNFNTKIIINEGDSTLVAATNLAAEAAYHDDVDVFVFMSDDFLPHNKWNIHIRNVFNNCPHPRMLKVNDKVQIFSNVVLTIPIMNRVLYEQLGYFWHPRYKARWCDVDLYYTTLKYIVRRKDLTFPHLHKNNGEDETYRKSDKCTIDDLRTVYQRSQIEQWGRCSWLDYAVKEAKRKGIW